MAFIIDLHWITLNSALLTTFFNLLNFCTTFLNVLDDMFLPFLLVSFRISDPAYETTEVLVKLPILDI